MAMVKRTKGSGEGSRVAKSVQPCPGKIFSFQTFLKMM
jgi:hypothetical protein